MRSFTSLLSDHLLVGTTLAYVGGLALAPRLAPLDLPPAGSILVLLGFLALLVLAHLGRRESFVFWLLPPTVALFGAYHGYLHFQPPTGDHIYHQIEQKTEVVLVGILARMVEYDGRASRIIIEAEKLRFREHEQLLATRGRVQLRLEGPWPEQFRPGSTLVVRAELRRPDSFRTPGAFDYAKYLAEKNIWITGVIRSPLYIAPLATPSSILHTLKYLPERLRTEFGRLIDAKVPPGQNGIYRAIMLGDRSQVTAGHLEAFKGSGTMHLLAISGLHMAVIGTCLYGLFFWLLSRSEKFLLHRSARKWAAFSSLPLLLGYGLLAGMNSPVFRAVIMSAGVILAICTERQKSPGPLVAAAGLVILLVDPRQLFTASFQLSFAAVIGLVLLLPTLKRLLAYGTNPTPNSLAKTVLRWAAAGLLVSVTATLATGPIALGFFHRFSTVGPVANLLVEPLICFVSLPAGFLALAFLAILPDLSGLLLQLGAVGLEVAGRVAASFSSLPFATVWLPAPPPWLLVSYYALLVGLALFDWPKARWPAPVLLVLATCLTILVHFAPAKGVGATEDFRLTVIDVGQGSSALLEYPSRFRVLIDGGGSSYTASNVGEQVIAPYLWHLGVRRLDAVVITHPDADHYNGLEFIIDRFCPKILWVSALTGHDPAFNRLLDHARHRGVAVVVPDEGQELPIRGGSLRCLANVSAWRDDGQSLGTRDLANGGLILKACSGPLCGLFPGDIGRNIERLLVDQGYPVQAEVLLAAHHGSITSNSPELLVAAAPRYLLVSAGRAFNRHFPHQGLAGDCQSLGIVMASTGQAGTLTVVSGQEGLEVFGHGKRGTNPLLPCRPFLLTGAGTTPR